MISDSFDILIVGAGTAGCVLANRLSADKSIRVGLIEAGPPDDYFAVRVPALIAMAVKKYNWGYSTAPQAQLNGRTIPVPRGRVLGGCSSINGMVYFRGHPGDFDDWAAAGNPGWDYKGVLPYFIRSENNEAIHNSPYHGNAGPMHVVSIARPNPMVATFLQSTHELKLRPNSDFNAADPEGFGVRQASIRGGRRESMVTAYLERAAGRSNLVVMTDCIVNRLVFDGRRVVGVDLIRNGEAQFLAARREVLLCAGAYGSPAILLRSGIGDGRALSALGITTLHHLPEVGRNLCDHPSAEVRMKTNNTQSYAFTWRAFPRNLRNAVEYLVARTGPIGGNVFEATGFTRSRAELPRPDLQIVFMPAARSTTPLPLEHGYGIISIATRPKSRGLVTITSPDPAAPPVIDPNYLAHEDDIRTVRYGLELGRQILGGQPFKKYSSVELVPGKSVQGPDALNDYIRRTAAGVHHPSSTCRMGGDESSVVDPTLRVRGLEHLRVVDASIFPTLVAGNTNAAVVMVAEKAADLILGRTAPPAIEVPHAS